MAHRSIVHKPDQEISFHIEEFKALRKEISRLDNAKRQLELFIITATALITVWLFDHPQTIAENHIQILWWVPLIVAVLGYLQSRSYVRRCYQAGDYIQKIEKLFGAEGLGWEAYLKTQRSLYGRTISSITLAVWGIMFVLFAAIGVRFCGWSGFAGFFTSRAL